LDKATPEPFGFNHDDSDFGYLSEGDKYWEVLYADKDEGYVDPWVGQLKPAKGADYVPNQNETEKDVGEGQKVNSIHCFEFLDNAVEVCNFQGKAQYRRIPNLTEKEYNNNISKDYYLYNSTTKKYTRAKGAFDPEAEYYKNEPKDYESTWYGKYKNADGDEVPGWTLGFESRYPEDRVGYHDADMLYPLAKWLNELHLIHKREYLQFIAEKKDPTAVIEEYEYIEAETHQDGTEYYIKIAEGKYEEAYPTAEDIAEGIVKYYTRKLIQSRFAMTSLERFKREYQCYFNKDFLLTYYLVTEALLMADSRVKNLMFATWGKEEKSYKHYESEEEIKTNNYIFYPIFYDMDTMLGLDNTGVDRFNYYDEDTDEDIYNGNEVLWNFVRDALGSELAKQYKVLEEGLFRANNILTCYDID
jgi:hypothetical protein